MLKIEDIKFACYVISIINHIESASICEEIHRGDLRPPNEQREGEHENFYLEASCHFILFQVTIT